MAGLSSAGFEKKTLLEIKTEIEDNFRASFGSFINLLPSSVFQTLIGIFSERESSLWDLAEAIYLSQYPSSAEGVNLDNVAALVGVVRQEAVRSRVSSVFLFGTNGALVPLDTELSVEGNPNAVFRTLANATLGAGTNEIQEIVFDTVPVSGSFRLRLGEQETVLIAFNANAAAVKAALEGLGFVDEVTVTGDFTAGFEVEFTGDSGLQPQDILVVEDNTLQNSVPALVNISITETQTGVAQALVDVEAVEVGPVDAPRRTLRVIDTPVSGLDRSDNANPAVLGRFEESDADLRLRRDQTLQLAGNATVDAIRSRIRNIAGVVDAFIIENLTLVPDGDGRPGKSYETYVDGGLDQEIGDAIWISKPAGIQTFGNIPITVVDASGQDRIVYFSRPVQVDIYFSLDLTIDVALFPSNGAAAAESLIIEWGNNLGIGQDVIVYPQLVAQLNSIPGILDVTVRIDSSPVSTVSGDPALDDNVVIAPQSLPRFDSTRGNINLIS